MNFYSWDQFLLYRGEMGVLAKIIHIWAWLMPVLPEFGFKGLRSYKVCTKWHVCTYHGFGDMARSACRVNCTQIAGSVVVKLQSEPG